MLNKSKGIFISVSLLASYFPMNMRTGGDGVEGTLRKQSCLVTR